MKLHGTEHDEFTGITKRWYSSGDKIICHKTWDEQPFLEQLAQQRAETTGVSFINNPRRMHKMASLPPIVVEKILKDHGINVMGDLTPSERKKLYRIIETEYPSLKTHEKRLWRPTR